MTVAVTAATEALVAYLQAGGGRDRYEFYDASGEPDPVQARTCAERLRGRLGLHLGVVARVEQSGNRVTVTLIA